MRRAVSMDCWTKRLRPGVTGSIRLLAPMMMVSKAASPKAALKASVSTEKPAERPAAPFSDSRRTV